MVFIMNIVIMGCSTFGFNLASMLISNGNDIILIEKNEDKSNNVANKLDAIILCGDGTDSEILEESNLEEADVFVAATERDENNILACILAKGYNVSKIISQVSDPNHKKAFKEAGIDILINPELIAASYIEKILERQKISDVTVLGEGDAELLDLTLDKGTYVGKRIRDLIPNDKFNIVAIYENGKTIFPKPDMILKPGIKISILVKSKFAKEILKRFTEDTKIEIFPGIKLE